MASIDSETARRILTFEDTLAQFFSSEILRSRVRLSQNKIELDDGTNSLMCPQSRLLNAKVLLTKSSALATAQNFIHGRTAVLDFASATTPGGGVLIGSRGQEEDLCRYTSLYFHLNSDFLRANYYEKNRTDSFLIRRSTCVYIPDVQIIKNPENSMTRLSEKQYLPIDVIVCAAPNLRKTLEIPSKDDLLVYHEERAKNIFQCAARHHVSNLILGAFGCGAFRNPPEIVATAYKNIIFEYGDLFDRIIFSFNCFSEKDENFSAFNYILQDILMR